LLAEVDDQELALPRDALVAASVVQHERQLARAGIHLAAAACGDDRHHAVPLLPLEEHVAQLVAHDFARVHHRVAGVGRREPAGFDRRELDLLIGPEPNLFDLPARGRRQHERQPAGADDQQQRQNADRHQHASGAEAAGR
jgi:hypothetical protein